MKRVENFPISKEIVDEFIKVNKKQWSNNGSSDRWIIVNFSMVRMQVAWIIPKLIYARGMADETNANVVVLTWRRNEWLTQLIESFGFQHMIIDDEISHHPIWTLKALYKTCSFMLKDGTGEGLIKLNIDSLSVGRSIYEDILRTSSLSTIKDARQKIVLKKMLHLLSFYYMMNSFCKKHMIVGAMVDDVAYHEGMLAKLLLKDVHCPVVKMNNVEKKKVIMETPVLLETTSAFLKKYVDKNMSAVDQSHAIAWTDKYLQDRFQGKNGRDIDRGAFANKVVLNREELCKSLGLDPEKKNVVIMAHTFTDAVFNYGDYYFRDYYDWLEKTLEIAREVENVNWILKPHPTRHAYNESEDSIEKMFARLSADKKHMFFMDDSISGETIANIADVQITIGGNAGAEYACFGVPTIIVGKPYYSGHGYTMEPSTYEEYVVCLHNVSEIKRLSDEQIITAKCVFYLRNSKDVEDYYYRFRDEFAQYVNSRYRAMLDKKAIEYFNNNDGTQSYNDQILKDLITYISEHDMMQCEYYQLGKKDMEK